MDRKVNRFNSDTPEWQLFENAKGSEALIASYTADAQRFTEKAQAARQKAERYWAALEKLTRGQVAQ